MTDTATRDQVVDSSTGRSTVRINDADVAYQVYGEGDQVALFLGGNLLMDPSTAEFIDGLVATGLRVVVPFLPGYGRGELPPGCSTAADLALIADSVLEDLQLRDVTVIGEAIGGWVALEMALNCPTRIGQIILLSPWGIRLAARDQSDFMDMYAADRGELSRAFYGAAAHSVEDYMVSLPIEELESYARAEEAMALLAWSPYLYNSRLTTWRQRLTTPMYLISSPDDKFARPGYYKELKVLLNIAEHTEITGAPHLLRYASAATVICAITRFINHFEVR